MIRGFGAPGFLIFVLPFFVTACAHRDELPLSAGHLGVESPASAPATSANIPPPVRLPAYVPPPKPAPKQQTFSIVVHETPVKDLLFALARDSKMNVDVHPNIQGLVTLNALNETLPAILERIKKQVNLRYTIENNRLSVVPDTPYLQTYRIDYVNMSRAMTSSIGVATQVASTGTTAAEGGGTTTGGAGNSSTTTVASSANNNFWEILSTNIRTMLRSTNAVTASADERSARMEAMRALREERIAQAEAVSRAGQGAQALFNSAFSQPLSVPGDGNDDVVVNPIAGTLTILATERQHMLVRKYVDEVADSSQRQVLIEATIVEVTLSDRYQAGVDWSRIAIGSGFSIAQQTLAGRLAVPPNVTIGYSNTRAGDRTISAAIRLLESFGNTRVLSSPKLMALNNQTALLKVVDEVVYFTTKLEQRLGNSTNSGDRNTFTSTLHTVPVGMIMSVTPQIGANHAVTLNVRPTVSRITRYVPEPAAILNQQTQTGSGQPFQNLIPEIQVREMESVLQVESGQTVILGGLMQNNSVRTRDGVPVLSRLPEIGDVFSTRDENASKTELVIFLRPTVVVNPSLASGELRTFQQFLPSELGEPGNPAK